jgi:hypothetical protein
VASAVIYSPVANLSALAALSPADGDYFELGDSTGAESSSLVSGVPVGIVGAAGLTFRLRYDDPPDEFAFLGYFANDSETRYLKLGGGTLTGQLKADDSTSASTPGYAFDGDPNTGVGRPGADELALITGGAARVTMDSAGAVAIPGSLAVTGALTNGGENVVITTDARLSDTRTPTDGTVSTSKIADGAVTSNKIADGTIVDGDINASAAIVDTKLATIATAGKVSNSATTATNANTASAIVARDASGNFSAGTITAALTGAASANVLKAGDTMTGVLAVTAGTAALPAITPSGDPNTGIFSPGADQVAISTNGTGRLFVDASGNVGLGTSSPTELFSIGAGTVNNRTAIGGSSLSLLAGGYASTGAGSSIELGNGHGDGGDTASWIMQSVVVAGGGVTRNNHLTFSTRTAFSNVVTERLRITPGGAVGIGTTSPSSNLTVGGNPPLGGAIAAVGSAAGIALALSDNTNSSLYVRTASGGAIIGTDAGNALRFATSGNDTANERARIDTSGRLLVGTSTASGTSAGSVTATAGVFSTNRASGTIANGASISVTVPTRGAGACYLVTASRRQGAGDNFQGLFLVHYSSNSSPQAVITINALSSMTLSAGTDQITLTNGLGFNTAATLSAVRIG